jgi:competence protein ComGC
LVDIVVLPIQRQMLIASLWTEHRVSNFEGFQLTEMLLAFFILSSILLSEMP